MKKDNNEEKILNLDMIGLESDTDYIIDTSKITTQNNIEENYKINCYIGLLNSTLKEDLSKYTDEQLQNRIIRHNKEYIDTFINDIKQNAFDLLNDDVFEKYVNLTTTATIELQLKELKKLGYNKFIATDFEKKGLNKDFVLYIDINTLIKIQKELKNVIELGNEITDDIVHSQLYKYQKEIIIKNTKKLIKDREKYYISRHNKYLMIQDLLEKINEKFKEQQNKLKTNKNELSTDTNNFKPVIPEYYSIINNQVANNLDHLAESKTVDLTNKGHEYTIELFFDEWIPEKQLDYLDVIILTHLYLLFQYNTYVTSSMIFYSITGGKTKRKNPKIIKLIEDRIKKLRHTDISMQMDKLKDKDIKAYQYFKDKKIESLKGSLLNLMVAQITQNGQQIEAYYIAGINVFFNFCLSMKQFINNDIKYLENSDKSKLQYSEENIILTNYIVERITKIINSGGKLKNKITYESIYKALNLDNKCLNQKQIYNKTSQIRYNVLKILDDKKDKGLIKSYEEYKEKQTLKGVKIVY